MAPVGLRYRSGKGWMLVHECQRCGHRQPNRVAVDDPRQPDSPEAVARVGAEAGNGAKYPP